jgi:hypothetical protein
MGTLLDLQEQTAKQRKKETSKGLRMKAALLL